MDKLEFIENNLLPAILIDGQEQPAMNLLERMAYYQVPGVSLAIIDQGEIAYSKGYGVADIENKQPVTNGTLFQAASISKPVTALAAMALVQQGKLDLDADVNTVLKSWHVPENEFTQKEKGTLRRLLSHNAGLTAHGFRGYAQGEEVPTIQQVLQGVPPANSEPVVVDVLPGSIWRYSGGGTTVAQLLLMEITGLPHAELMQKLVLGPAGMSKSTYEQPLPQNRWNEAASGHGMDGNLIPGKWHTYPEQAAAGLWTTPEDLCKYIIELQKSWHGKSNKILSQESTHQMLSIQFGKWGIGPRISGSGQSVCFAHGGSNEGFRCEMMGFIHNGQGIAVMTNSDNGDALCQEIIRSAALAYNWQDFLPARKNIFDFPEYALDQYTGTYKDKTDMDFKLDIAKEDGKLTLTSPLSFPTKLDLFPETETRFFNPGTGFEFEWIEQNGNMKMTIHIDDFELETERID